MIRRTSRDTACCALTVVHAGADVNVMFADPRVPTTDSADAGSGTPAMGAGQRCSPLHQQRGRNLCLQLSPTDPPHPACRRLTQLQVHPPVATGVGQSSASEAPFTLLPVTACTVHSDLRVTGTTRVYGFAAVPVPLLALTRRVIGFKLAPSVGLQQGQGQAGLRLGLKLTRNRLR